MRGVRTVEAMRLRLTAPTVGLAVVAGLAGLAGCAGDPAPTDSTTQSTSTPSATAEEPSASAAPAELEDYVALGDSYTAAPGVPITDASDPCQRSTGNYPHLLAERLDLELTDVSCSGAESTHLTEPQPFLNATVPPQLDAVSAETDLVTLGIGGNDLGLIARLVGRCYQLGQTDPTGSPCTDADGPQLVGDVPAIEERVRQGIEAVREAAPRARIVVVDYPQLVPEEGTCEQLALASGDYPLAREVNAALSEAVRSAAESAGVEHVDVLTASEGHDICSEDPWVNGLDLRAPAAPFHPFADEQEAVADLLEELLLTD